MIKVAEHRTRVTSSPVWHCSIPFIVNPAMPRLGHTTYSAGVENLQGCMLLDVNMIYMKKHPWLALSDQT